MVRARWLWVASVIASAGCGRVDFDPMPGDGSVGVDGSNIAPWQLVQVVGHVGSPVTIAPAQAKSLLVVAIEHLPGDVVSSVTDSAADTYVSAMAAGVDGPGLVAIELWFAAGVAPGATRIAIAGGPLTVKGAVVWEVSGISTSAPLDVAAAVQPGASTASPVGPLLTTRSAGEFIVEVVTTENNVQVVGLHAGSVFTNDATVDANGWGHLTDAHAPAGPYQGQWDSNASGTYVATGGAFVVGP